MDVYMTIDALLQPYLQMILATTNARAVSLLFANTQSSHCQLYHHGQSPLPEVANVEQASAFIYQHQALPAAGIQLHASRDPRGCLLSIALPASRLNRDEPKRRDRRQGSEPLPLPAANRYWLALSFETQPPGWLGQVSPPPEARPQWPVLLQQGTELLRFIHFNQALMRDPLTQLPSRQEFSHHLGECLHEQQAIAMLQVNPKNFHQINKKFGRDAGDQVIGEIAKRLTACLRKGDLLSRFGGALFAVALAGASEERAREVGEKICQQLRQSPYLQGAIELEFSIGIGHSDEDPALSTEDRRTALLQRSDQALLAAHALHGSQVIDWQDGCHTQMAQAIDRLSGIFTADTTTDYRNMLLLWDIANITATECLPDPLLQTSIERLQQVFAFDNAGLLTLEDNNLQLISLDDGDCLLTDPEFIQQQLPRLKQGLSEGQPCSLDHHQHLLFAVPLPDETQSHQLFWFQGQESDLQLDHHDQLLLSALARQLGRALTRALMEEETRQRQQKTLNSLRNMVSDNNLVFCSPQMQSLMGQARRAAQTDITMLITGESGTGKEQLTKAIHKMSARQQYPLVVVDCSAIPDSLIESELFGHEKGAFTGAHQRRSGRILEANRGTLMLDEIGELPLQVQSKLLRVVQEKQLQPVGSNKVIDVDVRIIAVTNRDLQSEVEAGRFREDLYYRLNVLELKTPPLRDRTGDLLYLCEHFLTAFAQQYQMETKTLSPAAEALILDYDWPGNIRQLQNRLLQAVVLCDTPQLQPKDLKLVDNEPKPALPARPAVTAPAEPAPAPANNNPKETPAKLDRQLWWQEISDEFDRQIEHCLKDDLNHDAPLAAWLEDELILGAYHHADDNARQAAKRLGLAPSTLRRKLDKLLTQHPNGLPPRPAHWTAMAPLLAPVIAGQLWSRDGIFDQLHQLLLQRVQQQLANEPDIAARLMAVSEVTLQRWLARAAKAAERSPEPA